MSIKSPRIIIALAVASFVFDALAMEEDSRPGSRSVYAVNHLADKTPSPIEFALRQCSCSDIPEFSLCPCWSNFDKIDQPAVQGDFGRITVYTRLFGKFFPGFGIAYDATNHVTRVTIPSPQIYLTILKFLDMDYLELVSGKTPVTVDEYLSFLSKKKIPIASIPQLSEGADGTMLYHLYLHDLFNHAPLWTTLPGKMRDLIAERAQKILQLSAVIKQSFPDDQSVADFVELLKFFAVAYFDIKMGTLNNQLFSRSQPLDGEYDFEPTGTTSKKYNFYGMCNFGIQIQDHSLQPKTILDLDKFVATWFFAKSESILYNFRKVDSSKKLEDFDTFNIIEKNQDILSALKRLNDYLLVDLEDTQRKILKRIESELNVGVNGDVKSSADLPSIEFLCAEIKGRLHEAFKRTAMIETE